MVSVYWSHTFDDLKTLVKLKSQEEMVKTYQQYETFRLVVAEALGGKKQSSPTASVPSDGSVGSWEELSRAFMNFGTVNG